ncbi:hypothetical protein GCM10027435_05160 [Haloparvum alkalitolerans]|uniref:hypothetical protein n=1 Tax=Haloparvum alkalitolerans TaxID=1042953 RepID=UPI003CEB34DC
MLDSYRGALGAIPYALFASRSWLFRVYVLVGTAAAALIAVVMTLALVVEMGNTEDLTTGGLASFTRTLFVLAGFLTAGPLLAPTLLVARRHRREESVDDRYDAALALAGFGFLASIYLALLISAPAELREPTTSAVVGALYAAPSALAVVPPLLAATAIAAVHRRLHD